ncbi:MAG: 2OG-Fe(II) oxygenase [Acidiferrobacterales bacterium]
MLNEDIDVQRLTDEFRRRKRIRIRNVLKSEDAQACHTCLTSKVPWTLRFRYEEKSVEFTAQQLTQMTPPQKMQLSRDMPNFDFIHHRFGMDEEFGRQNYHDLDLYKTYQYLRSDHFLDFVRTVTGFADIRRLGAMATRFDPGQFLKEHDDYQSGEQRLCAYVLNLSRDWQPDWGGLLHFLDYDRNVVDSFVPVFNSLSLFAVPARHFVSMVSSFAKEPRYSVTGWCYAD